MWACDISNHYPVFRLDSRQDSEFVTGYPKTAFNWETDMNKDIWKAFLDIFRIQTLRKSCTLHNHVISIFGNIFSAFCAMTASLSMV